MQTTYEKKGKPISAVGLKKPKVFFDFFSSYQFSLTFRRPGGDDRVFTLLVRGRETYELLKRIRDSMELSKMASNDQLERLQVNIDYCMY